MRGILPGKVPVHFGILRIFWRALSDGQILWIVWGKIPKCPSAKFAISYENAMYTHIWSQAALLWVHIYMSMHMYVRMIMYSYCIDSYYSYVHNINCADENVPCFAGIAAEAWKRHWVWICLGALSLCPGDGVSGLGNWANRRTCWKQLKRKITIIDTVICLSLRNTIIIIVIIIVIIIDRNNSNNNNNNKNNNNYYSNNII